MSIDIPVIQSRMELGIIYPETGEIIIGNNFVSFICQLSTDCCGNNDFLVPVNDIDIERIEKHGYELDQIVEILSPEIRFADDNTAEKNYWIKRKPFSGKCTFLENNLCSIHEFKPFACRIFPFQLLGRNDGGYTVTVHQSNLCKSVKSVKKKNSENKKILDFILYQVQLEDKRRLLYFEKYGQD